MSYDIISPDGFAIDYSKTYKTKEEAIDSFNSWKKRFEEQGYYSSNYGRIPLDELEDNCSLIELDNDALKG